MSGHTRRNNKEYDADCKKARKLYQKGLGIKAIAIKLGLTLVQVRQHLCGIEKYGYKQ